VVTRNIIRLKKEKNPSKTMKTTTPVPLIAGNHNKKQQNHRYPWGEPEGSLHLYP
jgi:hypothetical protein